MKYPKPESPEEAVVNGAHLLDEKGPEGWRARVDPSRLNINDGRDCVLGQVYGDWEAGVLALGLADATAEADHGFLPRPHRFGPDGVRNAWVKLLAPPAPDEGAVVE